MKSSLKVLVAALAMATAGGAFAQTDTGTANGSDTYFYAYDNSTATSFVLDLGSNLVNFNGNVNVAAINVGAMANYSAFANAVTDNFLVWGVFSAATTGSSVGTALDVTTSTLPVAATKAKYIQTDAGDINNLMAGLYANNIVPSIANGGAIESGAVAQNAQSSVGANANLVGVTAVNPIGTSAAYINYSAGSKSGTMLVTPTAFAGNWTFNGTNLAYTVAAAVPEPSSVMMLLGGLLMIGTLAIRRRNSK